MDWKYILSMAEEADDLEESKKDELLNTIAWYDFSNEKVDTRKHTALLHLCQVIMKYKSEQVEALLAELDEIAMKQAEEEAKTRDSDDRSSRSKKSLDSDEQDMRFRELKAKYRKLQKNIDAEKDENEKLKQNVKMLEQERVYLQKELRNSHNRDDTASDISETVKDQQRSLMDNVQQKNAQISQLLTDIENVESDNLQLRAQLSNVRDDLSDATEKIEAILDENNNLHLKLEDLQKSKLNLESLMRDCKQQVDDLLKDKKAREMEFEQFAKEIDDRVEHWKSVLDAKNKEIDQLKSKTNQTFIASSAATSRPSTSSSAKQKTGDVLLCIDEIQVVELQKTLVERGENIVLLQKQLEKATKEMLKSAQVLKQITKERDTYVKKCEKINAMARDLRKQLKAAHQRSQELVDDIRHQDKLIKDKECDIQDILKKIEEPNLKKLLKEVEQVKTEKRIKEKKVSDLVKNCNKLQSLSDNLEKENVALRDRLGLTEEDFVSTKCFNVQQKRNKKLFDDLKNKLEICEEEKLQYRLELQKLSKVVSNLSDQLLDLGETPIVDGQEINVSNLRSDSKENIEDQTENINKTEYNTLLEENDALRKGLHEILDSVQSNQVSSARELKSETLEFLLRALDAKHVSGWYHPAMRLQAELHTLQGSNTTLREQLRIARQEMELYREKATQIITVDPNIYPSSNANVLAKLNNHLIEVLKNSTYSYSDEQTNVILVEKLKSYKKEFINVQEQIGVLYNQYIEEKKQWETDYESSNGKLKEVEVSNQALESKLNTIKLFTSPETEEEIKIKTAAESAAQLVIINRKFVFMENLETRYKSEVNILRNTLLEESKISGTRLNGLKEINLQLTQKLEKLENQCIEKFIFPEDVVKLQNDYDLLFVKNRELQRNVDEIQDMYKNELEVFQKKINLIEGEKAELVQKCVNVRRNSNGDDMQSKLAQSQINETTERQRANHTNSLYELVKEQQSKSEERHREYQKYNGELMQKNLSLQESVKSLEDIVFQYVDSALYQTVQVDRDKLLAECQLQNKELCELRDEIAEIRKDIATRQLWQNQDQYECHSLRHQIVDLQATSDDKAVIARLSNDVIMARMAEAEVRKKLDEMVVELATIRKDNEVKISIFSNDKKNYVTTIEAMQRRNSHLEAIIKQQRQHYYGYIPYTSEDKLMAKITAIVQEKRHIYEVSTSMEQNELDSRVLKETLELKTDVLNELNQLIREGDAQARALEKWFLDKTNIQLQELRCRRQVEFKEAQLKQAHTRLHDQELQIAQLEGELLQTLCLRVGAENAPIDSDCASKAENRVQLKATPATVIEITPTPSKIDTHHADTQTSLSPNLNGSQVAKTLPPNATDSNNDDVHSCKQTCELLKLDLGKKDDEIKQRSEEVQKLKQKILELEMSISLLRQQMGDKQSQISFYEKHILDLQQTKLETQKEALNFKQLQQTLTEKENLIFELQSLLKKDRDEHSRAAVCFQNELKQLQAQIQQQEQAREEKQTPARAAVEFYIQQVHALEKLTAELQTSVSTLGTQLQASREECGRWRTLSNDRLRSVDELRVQLEEQHQNELAVYKNECEKWRNEVKTLQLYISDYKQEIIDLRPNIEKELKDKDNKIHELLITLRQLKTELRRKGTMPPPTTIQRPEENLEEVKESLLREQEVLKKRCEQLLNREKSAREEIRNLKGQLMKRPAMSARSDNTNTATKEQQARRIQTLEKEVNDLREKLEREVALNESHKIKVSADFEKWNKLKHWQQTAEKTKVKLKEKTDECEKIQQTCSSYRMLIERLEREKHNLEVRLKNFKSMTSHTGSSGVDGGAAGDAYMMALAWETEKTKLTAEISALRTKVEQQQHHSGALSSAMLQDKLEAQERKIAILEISARGGGEMRSEMERIQNANAALQKANLRLEAESLDLRLDLEKSINEVPHLREQITYLENYIKLLKVNTPEELTEDGKSVAPGSGLTESKRISELERTVLVLKRVVEKLQVENKRLTNGNQRSCTSTERGNSGDRFKREYTRLKQQFDEKVEKVTTLEKELSAANQKLKNLENNGGNNDGGENYKEELNTVKEQLLYKGELLEKVKMLLQRAHVKEKALLDQISTLKGIIDSK